MQYERSLAVSRTEAEKAVPLENGDQQPDTLNSLRRGDYAVRMQAGCQDGELLRACGDLRAAHLSLPGAAGIRWSRDYLTDASTLAKGKSASAANMLFDLFLKCMPMKLHIYLRLVNTHSI